MARSAGLIHSAQWVAVSQTWKALEVAVVRVALRLILDGERGQMRVGREAPRHARRREQVRQDIEVPRPGLEHPQVRTIEPAPYDAQGVQRTDRIGEHGGMGDETDEAEAHRPRHANGLLAVDEILPPVAQSRAAGCEGAAVLCA